MGVQGGHRPAGVKGQSPLRVQGRTLPVRGGARGGEGGNPFLFIAGAQTAAGALTGFNAALADAAGIAVVGIVR